MAVIIWRACVWRLWLLSLGLCLVMVAGAAEPLDAGDRLGDDAFVLDASGQAVKLRQRMAQSDAGLTVLCLLGGGEMGAQSGALVVWRCHARHLHLAQLVRQIRQARRDFMVVAVTRCITPVGPFLSRLGPCCVRRGMPRLIKVLGVLSLTAPWPPSAQGTLPVRLLFDAENMLLAHPDAASAAASDRGALPDWRGRLRDPRDERVYGVPALWLFDRRGQVVSPPFRGSRYFNGGDIQLPYALSDVDAAIASALAQDR